MTIGQLAKRAGVNPQTIRYYEREGILPLPQRRVGSGYREYGEDTVFKLHFIREAQAAGFKLGQIRELLEAELHPERSCREVQDLIQARLQEITVRMRELRKFQKSLRVLLERCQTNTTRHRCPALSLLGGR